VIIATLIIGVAIKFIFTVPDNLAENNSLKTKITELTIKSHEDNNVKLEFQKITDFEWDKLYIITPYMPVKDFCKENGIKGVASIDTSIEINDTINLLMFVLDNNVVSYVNFPRNQADFYTIRTDSKQGFTPKDAVFGFNKNSFSMDVVELSN
jgi:hypothetical protein